MPTVRVRVPPWTPILKGKLVDIPLVFIDGRLNPDYQCWGWEVEIQCSEKFLENEVFDIHLVFNMARATLGFGSFYGGRIIDEVHYDIFWKRDPPIFIAYDLLVAISIQDVLTALIEEMYADKHVKDLEAYFNGAV